MKVESSIEINRPAKSVFPWIADPEKAAQWQKNIKSYQITNQSDISVGTTFTEIIEEDGKELELHGEIIRFIRNKEIGFSLKSKVHELKAVYSIEGNDQSSFVFIKAEIKWKFPLSVLISIKKNEIKKGITEQMMSEAQLLKAVCEK